MSARLSTAIRIGGAARAILRQTQSFPEQAFEGERLGGFAHVGVEPMLLALSMELALKAWFVFDYDDPNVVKSHNLTKLFEALTPESQSRLDDEFRRAVAPIIRVASTSTTASGTSSINTRMRLRTGVTSTKPSSR